ncbi:MAG TPA: hypothetical protein VIH42_02000 [Thermoguttaceae bacterium]
MVHHNLFVLFFSITVSDILSEGVLELRIQKKAYLALGEYTWGVVKLFSPLARRVFTAG